MRTKVMAAAVVILLAAASFAGYVAISNAGRTGTSASASAFTYQTITSSTSIATTTTTFDNSTISWSYASTSTSAFKTTWAPGEGKPIPAAMVVTANIPVGQISGPIAVDPGAGRIYVVEGSSLVVVDASSDSVVANVSLDAQTQNAIALDTSTHTVYVLANDTVVVVSGVTDTIQKTIPVDFGYGSLAYDPATRVLYGSPETGNLLAVDARTGSLVANISIGYSANQVEVDQTTNMVFLAGCFEAGLACNSTASVVDGTTERVVKTVNLGSPYYETSALNPSTGTFYVSGERQLAALNGQSGDMVFSVDPQSCGDFLSMTVDTSSNQVLMVPPESNYLAVYDGTTGGLLNMYSFLTSIGPLAFDSGNGELYVGTSSGQLLALRMLATTGNVNSTLIGSSERCLPV